MVNGSRETRQKRAIRDAFVCDDRPLTADEILESAQSRIEGIGIATVYRAIKALLADGWLTAIELPGRTPHYERAGKSHHDHFVCRICGTIFELDGCSYPDAAPLPSGFAADGHAAIVYGRCAGCAPLAVQAPVK